MALYDEKYPPKRNVTNQLRQLLNQIAMWKFKRKISKIHTGSREWHILQEKLRHGSSIGTDRDKRNYFYMYTLDRCGKALYVLPDVTMCFPQNIEIGYNVFINRGVYITARAKVTIGDHVAIGPYTVINSGSHQYSDPKKLVRQQGHRIEAINIEKGAWLGAHITVLPGVSIGEGAVVGSGAVVTKSVEPFSVVVGIPAHLYKYRGQ